MKNLKYLVLVSATIFVSVFANPAKALTSFYDRASKKLVIDGVNLDQDFTITESDLQEVIDDTANDSIGSTKAFFVRFFFSPSVESQIVEQIQATLRKGLLHVE